MLHLWSFGALYFSPIEPEPLKIALAYSYLVGIPLALLIIRSKKWALILPVAAFLCVLSYEWQIQPKANAVYQPQVMRNAFAKIQDGKVVFYNIRNNTYRTADDFDVHYETREYQLGKLRTVDVYTNYWGMDAIAHVFVSFGFADGRYLSVSIEYRPEAGESYGTFNGLFKQYEIIYIWADERDIARLRTNYRKEDVFLYRTTLTPEQARKLFISMVEKTNSLNQKPEFYNTVTQSCTNTIGDHIIQAQVFNLPWWKRRLLTGSIGQRLYDAGLLVTGSKPFTELKAESKINERAQAADRSADFSEEIRTHLNPMV